MKSSTFGRLVAIAASGMAIAFSSESGIPGSDASAPPRAGSAPIVSGQPAIHSPISGASSAEAPRPADAGLLARAQSHIAAREYHASVSGTGLQAPNRRHNLRTYFEPSGIRVHDRTAAGSPQLLSVSLVGVGRGEAITAVKPGRVAAISDGARVEIQRPEVVEWYANSAEGLEQGFTLAKRPTGQGLLALDLAVEHAEATLFGDHVVFATATGRQLAYDKLVVTDAQGGVIEANFEVPDAKHVRLVIADAGASYPLTIDPLLTETADTQLESNQLGGQMGSGVAGAGDVNGDGFADVIVGSALYDAGQLDEGAAFVFLGSASGIANGNPTTAIARIESNQVGARMGLDVAGAGDVNGDGFADVLVGSHLYDAPEVDEGAAWIFLGSPTGIASGNPATAAAQLEANQAGSGMGGTLSSAGDVNRDGYADVIIGAYAYDSGQADEGAAFIFLGSAAGVASGNPLTAATRLESNQVSAGLGQGVASAGDMNADGYGDVIVSAYLYDAGQTDEGAAFVFLGGPTGIANGNPSTAWSQLESNQASASMGISVDGAGDMNGDGYSDVIVGAYLYDSGQVDEGAAFVYTGSNVGVALFPLMRLESNQAGAQLGFAVAGAGDVNGDGYPDVIVGDWMYDSGQVDEGAAFVFLGGTGNNGDPTTAFAQFESNQSQALLGFAVAGAGDVNGDGYSDVLAGAYAYDSGQEDEGAAFVLHGGSVGLVAGSSAANATRIRSSQVGGNLGVSVAGAGDVNGDGYDDVIVGAGGYDAGQLEEGAAFLFPGSPVGVASADPGTAVTRIESNQANAQLGISVAGAGDVNGDGFSDVIVGAWLYDSGQADEGAAFLFLGSATGVPDGTPATATAQLESDQASARMGTSVASAGDVNGDGYADVIVGAQAYDAGQTNEGAAFLFLGSPSAIADGNPVTASAQIESNQASALLGSSVAGAGDVNGNGYADVIVGAYLYDAGQTDEGAAWIFPGGPTGIGSGDPLTASAQLESDQASAQMGFSVASAGDVNGDGYADVVVGAYQYDANGTDDGAAFVFAGSAAGVASGSPTTASGSLIGSGGGYGFSVAGAGDVNGDGYADVIVGAPFGDFADVVVGGPSGIGVYAVNNPTFLSDQPNALLGVSVASAGDVNGDGFSDVLVGAQAYSPSPASFEGAAFLLLGNQRNGRKVLARQLRGDASNTPVQPWGKSYADNSFKVRMKATNPTGRGRVKLEVERCSAGVPFGHISCAKQRSASWTDVTATGNGVELTETLSGLTTNTIYRWRARVLYAAFAVTQAGITAPANPAHGPWRRVSAQRSEADIRVVPEPGLWISLATGLAFLGWARRR